MGAYDSTFQGAIYITPPLSWKQIKDADFMPGTRVMRRGGLAVKYELEVVRVDTEEGPLDRTTAIAVVPASEDSYSGSTILADLQAIASAFGGSHLFSGNIERHGADAGDMSRYKIVAGKAVEYTPEITWPKESE